VKRTLSRGTAWGEFSALVAAGGLEFTDAVRLVRRRAGNTCNPPCRRRWREWRPYWDLLPRRSESFAARLPSRKLWRRRILNSPEQTVISGHAEAVKRAVELASAGGAKTRRHARGIRTLSQRPDGSRRPAPGSGLRATSFHMLRCALVTNTDAELTTDGNEARESLIRQVTLPVRWEESIRELWWIRA